jgi:F-type H+-transporting ATPase subunit b
MKFNTLTFVFEIVNFLVLLFILQRLVFRPLQRSINARRAAEQKRADETEAKLEAARSLEAELEQERVGLAALRDKAMRQAAEEAAAEKARILAQARADAATERAQAARLLESEREAAEGWLQEATVERATDAAGRMLLALAPEAVDGALRRALLAEVDRQGTALAPAAVEGAVDVELRAAKLPDSEIVETVRASISRAVGRPVRLALREDESLGAGLVIAIGDRVLDATISGQLQGLRERTRALLTEGNHE